MDNLTTIVMLVAIILMGLLTAYSMLVPRMMNTFIMRKTQNRSGRVKIVYMMESTQKDGSVWWRSFPFSSIKIPAPPDSVIDVNEFGRKIAEGYMVSSDEVVWLKDTGIRPGEKILESFKPFSVTQRSVLVQELETAHMKRGSKWLTPEFIMPMTAIMVLGMFGICALIFGADLIKPLNTMASQNIQFQQENIKLAEMNARISQALGVKLGITLTDFPQTANPSEEQPTINKPESIIDKIGRAI